MSDNIFKNKIFNKLPKNELDELISSFMEIELLEPFPIVRETICRLGIKKNDVLYQTAHILNKRDKVYLLHFKQLFELDGRTSNYDVFDKDRLYKIAYLLEKWGLIKITSETNMLKADECKDVYISIAKASDVKDGHIQLKQKYNL